MKEGGCSETQEPLAIAGSHGQIMVVHGGMVEHRRAFPGGTEYWVAPAVMAGWVLPSHPVPRTDGPQSREAVAYRVTAMMLMVRSA
jgi:hypothetical protein